jgi:hypothetical protein
VGDIVSFLRAPDAGNPHVRCDEREQETEPCQTGLRRRRESSATGHREATATAPVLDSTRFPGGVALHPATRRKCSKGIAARRYFDLLLDYMHGEDHGTVTLSAKVSALAFKSSRSFRGKNDIRRLPLVKLLDPHVQLLND